MKISALIVSLGFVSGVVFSPSIGAQIEKTNAECWKTIKSNMTMLNQERDATVREFIKTNSDKFCPNLYPYSDFRFLGHGIVEIGTMLHFYKIVNRKFVLYYSSDGYGNTYNTLQGIRSWIKKNEELL